MYIDTLVIELGRMCNMNCPHCLRGHSQDITIDVNDVFKILSDKNIEYFGNIVFTGGEPTLYVEEIEKIIDFIIKHEISVCGLYIASNGKIYSQKLMFKLCELREYMLNKGFLSDDEEYKYRFLYDVSLDQFHEDINEANLNRLSSFSFFNKRGKIPENALVNEGNAYENGIGNRFMFNKIYIDENQECIELIYLNAKGNVLWNCDLSYDTQDSENTYSIKEYTLQEIVKMTISDLCKKIA